MISRSWGISKGASLAPQEIKMLLAVLPETKSQGLFHQIQKEVTFCGLPHEAYAAPVKAASRLVPFRLGAVQGFSFLSL